MVAQLSGSLAQGVRLLDQFLHDELMPQKMATFERRLMQERTHAGLAVARARGTKGGRIPRRAEEPRVRMAYTM